MIANWMRAAVVLAMLACAAPGQDFMEPDVEPVDLPPDAEWAPPGDMPGGAEGMRPPPGGEGRDPTDEWLQRVERENPEEFARMQELRRNDPRAFHDALRQRLQERWMTEAFKGHPELGQAYAAMSPEEQNAFAQKLYQPGRRYMRMMEQREGRRGGMHPGREHGEHRITPEILQAEHETLEIARAYKAATTDAERERIRQDLKTVIERVFDLRNAERRKKVESMGIQIENLQKKLAEREANREQIIDRRLLNLTEGDPLAW